MDDDWDFCDRPCTGPTYIQDPASVPTRREIIHFVSIKGDACGLTNSKAARSGESTSRKSKWVCVFTNPRNEKLSEANLVESGVRNMGIDNVQSMPASMQLALKNRLSTQHILDIERLTGTSDEMPYLFYGSTAFPSMLSKVIGEKDVKVLASRMTSASICGVKRFAVRGKPYPALVKTHRTYHKVSGMLVFGIHDVQRDRIAAFEGQRFELESVYVTFENTDGCSAGAMAGVYYWNGDSSALVSEEEHVWQPEDLLRSEWFQQVTGNDLDES